MPDRRSHETHAVVLEWTDDDRTVTVDVAPGETITDAVAAADVSIPYGCLRGACATCTAELLEGTVEHRRPPRGLKTRHLDDGYVLACVATPTADCRLRVGAGVQDELVENPWR